MTRQQIEDGGLRTGFQVTIATFYANLALLVAVAITNNANPTMAISLILRLIAIISAILSLTAATYYLWRIYRLRNLHPFQSS